MSRKTETPAGNTVLVCPRCESEAMARYGYCKKCGHFEGIPP